MSEFKIVNVVGTIDFQQRIALRPLANSLVNCDEVNDVDYDPSELHLIHSWFFEDDIYIAFYKNGTCSVTGVDSLDRFYEVADVVSDILRGIVDFEIETNVNLNNVVSTAEIGNIPSLEAIAIGLGLGQAEYEPEQFPALVYRGDDAVFLIFASGKIVCMGLTDLEQISSAIDNITEQIQGLATS